MDGFQRNITIPVGWWWYPNCLSHCQMFRFGKKQPNHSAFEERWTRRRWRFCFLYKNLTRNQFTRGQKLRNSEGLDKMHIIFAYICQDKNYFKQEAERDWERPEIGGATGALAPCCFWNLWAWSVMIHLFLHVNFRQLWSLEWFYFNELGYRTNFP